MLLVGVIKDVFENLRMHGMEYFKPSRFTSTHLMAYSKVKLKSNGDKTSPCFKPFLLTLILRRSRTGTVWFYTSTSNKRAARPKLYTKSLTRDLKLMHSRLTLVRISINLWAPCVLYMGSGVSLLYRERFLYI